MILCRVLSLAAVPILSARLAFVLDVFGDRSIPIGSIVVPSWDYLIGSLYEPQKGTTLEPMGIDFFLRCVNSFCSLLGINMGVSENKGYLILGSLY